MSLTPREPPADVDDLTQAQRDIVELQRLFTQIQGDLALLARTLKVMQADRAPDGVPSRHPPADWNGA